MSRYIELISGQRGGFWARVQRAGLRALAGLYRPMVRLRNGLYDRGWRVRWLDVPVIAVGNITTGGTGKTPLAIWLCRQLDAMGRRPAVVSRGYKAPRGGLPDEMLLVSRRCPQATCVAHADRLAAGALAVERYGADVVVLDDGFQHRRLGRDLDIVLIDAACPFGYGHVLPRGLLREPLTGLRRADIVIITRYDLLGARELDGLTNELRELAGGARVVRARHKPVGLVDLEGEPVASPAPQGARVICFAGIGNPRAFATTVRQMGMDVLGCCWWPDHYPYSPQDVRELADLARQHGADLLVTTEKDAVRLAGIQADWPCPVRAVRIEIDFPDEDGRMIRRMIANVLDTHASSDGRRQVPPD